MSSSSSYWLRSSASWRSSPVIGRTASGAVGVLYRWWKWDTLWQCSLSIFQWGCRGYECAAESLLLQPQEALQLWIACPIIQSPKKLIKHPRGICCYTFFFLSQTFFLFVWLFVCFLKVTACVNERPCHFLLTTYLRFCVAFARLCSISKDLLARWKAQQRQRSHKGKRDACVVKFPRGIFSLTGETTDWVLFWLSESERKKGGTKRKEKKERERALNAAFDLQGDQGTVVEATDLLHYSFHPFHSPALLVLSPPFSEHRLSDGPASQRPKLHQSRGFVLRGRPDGTLHESVHPLHHRHTLRALLATGGDRGGTEEETVAKTQSPKRETRSATQRNVSKHERNALQLNVFSKRGVFG